MIFSKLKTRLIMGASLILAACSGETSETLKENGKMVADKAAEQMKDKMNTTAYKMVEYTTEGQTDADHLYLEEVLGNKALDEVKGWNQSTLDRLMADPRFEAMQAEALEILNSKDKIPYVSYRGGEVHNFWQDADSVRGVWRKSTLDSYLGDDDGGFVTEESKGTSSWLDKDHMVVGVDFGDGTMTDSGYPMIAKLWKRGTDLSKAVELGRGEQADVGYWPGVFELSDGRREIVLSRSKTFYTSETFWVPMKDGKPGELVKFPVPEKANIGSEFKGQVLLSLNEDWRGFKSGDLVSFAMNDFMDDGEIADVNLVFSPDKKSSMNNYGVTKSKVLMSVSRDVKGSALAFDWDGENWTSETLDFPANGSVSIGATNDKEDVAFISSESFLTPDTLWTFNTETMAKAKAKSLPSWFDAESMVSEQFFATSTDGTKVPYFVVRNKDVEMDGTNPTLLYGYGGFEISLNPSYSATRGKLWLERGGVYVLANIRGGSEYGPKWHQAGLKTNRQRIYDDFISVAEDLIAKDITSPAHLGIEGGSNGGLLTGVMYTQRPDLFNAAIVAVPLLDMLRFNKLLAGASWMGEYGNPDDESKPEERAFLRKISPYHNIRSEADYPEVFFITSTKDDRVHPAHARKAAKRMEDQGHDFLYYENIDGGHSAAANLKETAKRLALQHVYLMQKLKDGE